MTTFRIEQRFLDKTHTRRMDGFFNVYAGSEYIGHVSQRNGAWEWLTPTSEMHHRFNRAEIIAAVERHAA